MPIDLAVARNASREAGSNEEARRARGLEALTLRWLGMSLPPDEDWVVLTYSNGKESKIQWQSVEPDTREVPSGEAQADIARKQSGDRPRCEDRASSPRQKDSLQCARAEGRCRRRGPSKTWGGAGARRSACCPMCIPSSARSKRRQGHSATCASQRLHREGGAIDAAVDEFVRILRTLPPSGLILDVRGNGGGLRQLRRADPPDPEPVRRLRRSRFTSCRRRSR